MYLSKCGQFFYIRFCHIVHLFIIGEISMSDEVSKEWNEEHLISERDTRCPSNWDELEAFLEKTVC